MRTAHRLGLPTSATMMYGHVETPRQRVEPLIKIRDLQAECPPGRYGFVAFIPWIFRSSGTPARKEGVDAFFSPLEYLRIIALSRIVLSDIRHIQASWLTVGKETAQIALHGGADDMGSIMIEEKRRFVGRSPQPARCRRHPPRDPRGGFHAPAARPALPVQGIDRNFRPLSAFSVSLRRSEQEKSVPMKPDSAASGINRIVRGPTFRLRNEDERAGNLRRRRQFRIHVPSLLFSTVFAIIHAYIFH